MGFQWDEVTTRTWLFNELNGAIDRAQHSDGEPAGEVARGEAHAFHRVLHHIFDDVDVDMLDVYMGQIDEGD